jgi:Secretion system C-terminal sorting domain
MKKIKKILSKSILFLLGLICFSVLHAQTYSFRHFKDQYRPLDMDSSTNITENKRWNDYGDYYDIPIGFDFELGNVLYDSLRISPEAAQMVFFQKCRLNSIVSGPMITAFSVGLLDRGVYLAPHTPMSPILYQTKGLSGERVLTVEWRNAGIKSGVSDSDHVNLQVWFYESTLQVEIRYGGGYVEDTVNSWTFIPEGPGVSFPYKMICSPLMGLEGALVYGYRNNPKDTVVDTTNFPTDPYYYHITGIPDEGMVYQFNPWPVGIDEIEAMDDIQVFPNPATDWLQIKTEIPEIQDSRFVIMNMMGVELAKGRLTPGGQIDVSSLAPGMYLLYIRIKDRILVKKFSKL